MYGHDIGESPLEIWIWVGTMRQLSAVLFVLQCVYVPQEPLSVVACAPAHSTSCTVTRAPQLTIVSRSRLFSCQAGKFPVGEDSVFPVLCVYFPIMLTVSTQVHIRPICSWPALGTVCSERAFLFISSVTELFSQVLLDMWTPSHTQTYFVVNLKMMCVIPAPLAAPNEIAVYLFQQIPGMTTNIMQNKGHI